MSPRGRVLAGVAVAAIAIVVTGVVGGPRRADGPPLAPEGTGPDGARAVLDTLRALGVDVTVGDVPPPAGATGLLLSDALTDTDREALRDWVQAGGVLVLADPFSSLAPELAGSAAVGFTSPALEPACDSPLVADVQRVTAEGGFVYDLPGGAGGCFPRNDGHWLADVPTGAGRLIAAGSPLPFTNAELLADDHAVLAARLLTAAGNRVHVLQGGAVAGGGRPLLDLVPRSALVALAQGVLAFVVFAAWRARRLGAPISEPQPVVLPASETVVAAGNLLQRADATQAAAAALRDDLLSTLRDTLGLPADLQGRDLIDVVAARSSLPARRVAGVLAAPPPADRAALVAYAQQVEALRGAVLRPAVRPATTSGSRP